MNTARDGSDSWYPVPDASADILIPGVSVLLRLMAMAPEKEIDNMLPGGVESMAAYVEREYLIGQESENYLLAIHKARRLWAMTLIAEANK